LTYTRGIYGRWTTLVNAGRFGFGDAFELALLAQVSLELCEYPEHIQKALAGRCASIDRLLGGFESGTFSLHSANDVLKISDTAGKPIDASDHQHVTLTQEVENGAKLGADQNVGVINEQILPFPLTAFAASKFGSPTSFRLSLTPEKATETGGPLPLHLFGIWFLLNGGVSQTGSNDPLVSFRTPTTRHGSIALIDRCLSFGSAICHQ
jgi:hypothetical protein